jgi:hypothetical protein
MSTELSWEPRRYGSRYCSPGCGAGCTKAAYDTATKAANALAKSLGDDWKPHVWENLGWHYSAISACGRWKIHPSARKGKVESYHAFLGDADSPGGRWVESGATPQEAIENTRKTAREEIGHFMDLLDMAKTA